MRRLFSFWLLLFSCLFPSYALVHKVVDLYTQKPITNAEVNIIGTDIRVFTDKNGVFNIDTSVGQTNPDQPFTFKAIQNSIYWESSVRASVKLVNAEGKEIGYRQISEGAGVFDLQEMTDGLYFIHIRYNNNTCVLKMLQVNGVLSVSQKSSVSGSFLKSARTDSLLITAQGYYQQKCAYSSNVAAFELMALKYSEFKYVNNLLRPETYSLLQGSPLTPLFGEVRSVKLLYSINEDKVYFINSVKYSIHYDFANLELNYTKGHYFFNIEQYSKNPNRIYILANLNYFTASKKYTLDFFPGDELTCEEIAKVYNKVAETSYIGTNLKFYANTTLWQVCSNVPLILSDELYAGQNYQPLNVAEGYGYLKKIELNEVGKTYLGRHDIVLVNGIPNDISVVSGIITTDFQTPLSHINVLSHNRETPNMALRDGWTNNKTEPLVDKLVYLKVNLDSFIIREATLEEAQAFWTAKEPQTQQKLKLDTLRTGLVDLSKEGVASVPAIGGKAANFAELMKVKYSTTPIPLPEGAFAIPVYYYWQHMKKYGLDKYVAQMLKNDTFWLDINYRTKVLAKLQDSIIKSPIDEGLMALVNAALADVEKFQNIRFRSSTNAEDIEGFNGAGLYDSFTGIKGDTKKTPEKAIKKTWASVWNLRAFEERQYFKIDQNQVAMAVLVHRSFPAEAANGVVITKHLYNPYNPAITVNVQVGEISIVNPTENYLPDIVICYLNMDQLHNTIEYVSHSTVPGMEGETVLTEDELVLLRKYCTAIQNHYCMLNEGCKTLDIEFKVDLLNGVRKLYIKQARIY